MQTLPDPMRGSTGGHSRRKEQSERAEFSTMEPPQTSTCKLRFSSEGRGAVEEREGCP